MFLQAQPYRVFKTKKEKGGNVLFFETFQARFPKLFLA